MSLCASVLLLSKKSLITSPNTHASLLERMFLIKSFSAFDVKTDSVRYSLNRVCNECTSDRPKLSNVYPFEPLEHIECEKVSHT